MIIILEAVNLFQMKKFKPFFLILGIAITLSSCKAIGRAAAKYWTKKQIKEFVADCENKAGKIIGEEKATKYCDCAVDVVAEKYQNYEEAKKIGIRDIMQITKDCQ